MGILKAFFLSVVALVVVSTPGAQAQGLDGLFSGGRKAFEISLKVIQCQQDDDIPEGLPGLPEPQSHPACGSYNALKLVETTFTLLPGQKKTWQKTRTVPVAAQVYKPVLEDGQYKLEQKSTTEKALKSGYEMEVYIPEAARDEASIALWVRYYSLNTESEEMLLHSDGDVYLNPHARQIERLSVFSGTLAVGEETIWGGQSALRAPAQKTVPQIYPEDARLWVEISLQK